jgi:Nif-specific regulatory protein
MNGMARTARVRSSDVAMHGVYEVTKLLASSSSAQEAMPSVVRLLFQFLELHEAAIGLCEGERELELICAHGSRDAAHARLSLLLREACQSGRLRTPWIVESEWCEPMFGLSCDEFTLDRSFVSVPIRAQGRQLGVLCIERSHGPGDQADFCFDADVQLLGTVANMIAAAERTAPGARGSASAPSTRPPVAREQTPEAGAAETRVIGESARWGATLQRARACAKSSSTVLLRGESGTGKEVLARLIHETSPRHARPFVSVNCAALSEQVLESELFGHERGAFTGAIQQRKGRFELAHGGTLLLDEIGEISGAFQARLLRVLQLGEFERVGGTSTLKVDVRLIAATNRNLEREVQCGRFRADLYYRLSVVPIFLPALRERSTDIPALAQGFLQQFNLRNGTEYRLHPGALSVLLDYPFPGNVRELENSIQRAATLADGPVLSAKDFAWMEEEASSWLAPSSEASSHASALEDAARAARSDADADEDAAGARSRLVAAMERAGWVQAKAARLLGLTPRQIAYALHKHGIPLRKL